MNSCHWLSIHLSTMLLRDAQNNLLSMKGVEKKKHCINCSSYTIDKLWLLAINRIRSWQSTFHVIHVRLCHTLSLFHFSLRLCCFCSDKFTRCLGRHQTMKGIHRHILPYATECILFLKIHFLYSVTASIFYTGHHFLATLDQLACKMCWAFIGAHSICRNFIVSVQRNFPLPLLAPYATILLSTKILYIYCVQQFTSMSASLNNIGFLRALSKSPYLE